MFVSSFQLSPVLAAAMSTVCIYCAESDPAAVYSTVRRDDVTYGRIIIKDKKKQSKRRGEEQPLCFVSADPTQLTVGLYRESSLRGSWS